MSFSVRFSLFPAKAATDNEFKGSNKKKKKSRPKKETNKKNSASKERKKKANQRKENRDTSPATPSPPPPSPQSKRHSTTVGTDSILNHIIPVNSSGPHPPPPPISIKSSPSPIPPQRWSRRKVLINLGLVTVGTVASNIFAQLFRQNPTPSPSPRPSSSASIKYIPCIRFV